MALISWLLPKRIKALIELLKDWEVDDVSDAVQLVSLLTAHVDGIDNYRTSVAYAIEMLTEFPDGKVSPGRLSKWGGGKYLGILKAPRR
jgi:hypothetical protein